MVNIEELTISTEKDTVLSVTEAVLGMVEKSRIQNGIITVETRNPSTGIVRLPEKAVLSKRDLVNETKRMIPSRIDLVYKESAAAAAGNIKGAVFGTSVTAIIHDGRLAADDLGIFFAEYDGPGKRNLVVMIMGE